MVGCCSLYFSLIELQQCVCGWKIKKLIELNLQSRRLIRTLKNKCGDDGKKWSREVKNMVVGIISERIPRLKRF